MEAAALEIVDSLSAAFVVNGKRYAKPAGGIRNMKMQNGQLFINGKLWGEHFTSDRKDAPTDGFRTLEVHVQGPIAKIESPALPSGHHVVGTTAGNMTSSVVTSAQHNASTSTSVASQQRKRRRRYTTDDENDDDYEDGMDDRRTKPKSKPKRKSKRKISKADPIKSQTRQEGKENSDGRAGNNQASLGSVVSNKQDVLKMKGSCSICLEYLSTCLQVRVLECFHMFCEECFQAIRKRTLTCPECGYVIAPPEQQV